MECIVCKKKITRWQTFLGFFWKGHLRVTEFSGLWEDCCSYKCYGDRLEGLLKNMRTETKEVLDLSDFLFQSINQFITVDQLLNMIKEIHTTEWAKHIIAAGYRKIGPNNNPVDKVFTIRNDWKEQK